MDDADLHRPSGMLGLAVRALVSIYWVGLAVFGCSRLIREGWGAAMAVIHAWYLAALVFLVVWGPATMIASLITARGEAKAPRRPARLAAYRLR